MGDQDENQSQQSEFNQEGDIGNPLRTDITDMHYAQLFFVVGHTAIKMLSYIEQMENDLKKQGNNAVNEAMA